MNKITLVLFFLILLIGCKLGEENKELEEFIIPKAIQTDLDSTKEKLTLNASNIKYTSPQFVGKFKFNEEINLVIDNLLNESIEDYIHNYDSDYLDTTRLDANGFEIYVDYEADIFTELSSFNSFYGISAKEADENENKLYYHFPIYVVNPTSKEKLFCVNGSYGIQEAKDTSEYDFWKPIEGKKANLCGVGTRWGIKVKPKEFIVILLTKYKGKTKTDLRTRLKIGESIIVSKPYQGNINQEQFQLADDDSNKNGIYYHYPEKWINWYFNTNLVTFKNN